MQGVNEEHWVELCEKSSSRASPGEALELTREINRLLNEKMARLDETLNPTLRREVERSNPAL